MDYYAGLIADAPRIEAFRAGIEEGVEPGDSVLEVGAGLGTYAFFAADAGAARVWAIDSDPVLHVAAGLARLKGVRDRVTFLRGTVPEVSIPERVDVMIFEDFAVRLLSEDTHRLLRGAAGRYLRDHGRMIPAIARLWIAPAAGNDIATDLFPGGEQRFAAAGLDWPQIRAYLANLPRCLSLDAEQLVGPARGGKDLALLPVPDAEDLGVEGHWTFDVATRVEALAVWFDLRLTERRWVANAPGHGSAWGQTVLPLDPPLSVEAGQPLTASVAPERLPDGAPGWLSWSAAAGHERRRGHEFAGDASSLLDLYPEKGEALGRP